MGTRGVRQKGNRRERKKWEGFKGEKEREREIVEEGNE